METIRLWISIIKKNVSIIFFTALGIAATFWVGIWYVPSWIEELKLDRQNVAQVTLDQSIKEIVYNDSTVTINDIQAMIESKETKLGSKYPLTSRQILSLIQDSFTQDKFLPLKTRKILFNRIESLKSTLPVIKIEDIKQESKSSRYGFIEWLSIGISIIAGVFGVYTLYTRIKLDKAKDDEIENQESIQEIESNSINMHASINYENKIRDIIKKYPDVKVNDDFDPKFNDFDVEFEYSSKSYFVEVKYLLRDKVGLKSIMKFINCLKGKEGEAWFIFNTELTDLVIKRIEEFNKLNKNRQIKPIRIGSAAQFSDKINELLPPLNSNQKNINNS